VPYPTGHRDRMRERIVRGARILFNRHGFDEVSIDAVMSQAGLTRGVFYSYFKSKSELYAEAISHALREPPVTRWPEVSVDFAAVDAARQVILAYLSEQYFEDIDGSCPMVALPSYVAHQDPVVKRALETVFSGMVGLFNNSLRSLGRDDPDLPLALAGMCIGTMVVARSLENRRLADSLRAAAIRVGLRLGGWHTAQKRRAWRARA
jgi:TetR/AcrR family transcriptional regulator, transcriptional repressor for nem operon